MVNWCFHFFVSLKHCGSEGQEHAPCHIDSASAMFAPGKFGCASADDVSSREAKGLQPLSGRRGRRGRTFDGTRCLVQRSLTAKGRARAHFATVASKVAWGTACVTTLQRQTGPRRKKISAWRKKKNYRRNSAKVRRKAVRLCSGNNELARRRKQSPTRGCYRGAAESAPCQCSRGWPPAGENEVGNPQFGTRCPRALTATSRPRAWTSSELWVTWAECL